MRMLISLKPADTLTITFLLTLISISLVFYKALHEPGRLLIIYLSLLLFQALLIKFKKVSEKNKLMDIAYNLIFPVICVLVIFDSLEWLVHYINPKDIDPLLIKLDYLISNGYPTLMLEDIQTPIFTDILQISYSTYYFLPISLGLILKLKGMNREYDKTLFLILLCFYMSYAGYMLFPALGPRYTINHLQSSELKGVFVAEAIQETLNRLEGIKRDAFPSGHTAVALVVSGLAYKFHRGFFYITLPVVAMLMFSTVYCRYHYVVDVIGGIILTAVTFIIGERFYGYWEDRNNINS